MASFAGKKEVGLIFQPPVLITESADHFAALRDELEEEIKPKGIVEQIYVNEFTVIAWEILRLRRCKTAMINSCFRNGLQSLLRQLMRPTSFMNSIGYEDEADALALAWFTDANAKKQVAALFRKFNLDEFGIEAETIRLLSADLERLDSMLASLESRRNKALQCLADYRGSFAKQVRKSSDRILENNDVPRLEHASKNQPTA